MGRPEDQGSGGLPELSYSDGLVLDERQLEQVREMLSPWSITSWVTSEGSGKTFSRTISVPKGVNEEYVDKLYHHFCDESYKKDHGLIEVFGGYDVANYSGGEFTNGEQIDFAIDMNGGPITMGDIERVVKAEEYLRLAGYLLLSGPQYEALGSEAV